MIRTALRVAGDVWVVATLVLLAGRDLLGLLAAPVLLHAGLAALLGALYLGRGLALGAGALRWARRDPTATSWAGVLLVQALVVQLSYRWIDPISATFDVAWMTLLALLVVGRAHRRERATSRDALAGPTPTASG